MQAVGPICYYRKSTPPRAFSRLVRKCLRRAKAFPHIRLHSHTIYPKNSDTVLPPWAERLYRATDLVRTVPASRAWDQLLADSRAYAARFRKRSGDLTVDSPLKEPSGQARRSLKDDLEGVAFCGYASGGQPDPALVVPIEFTKVSLPPADHRPQPIGRFLQWPWSEIFSDDGFYKYLVDDTPVHARTPVRARLTPSPPRETGPTSTTRTGHAGVPTSQLRAPAGERDLWSPES